MRRAVDAGEVQALERVAHRLRGSLMAFGAHTASEAALALETLGRHGVLPGAQEQITELEDGIQRLAHALQQFTHAESP